MSLDAKFYIGGKFADGDERKDVLNKYSFDKVGSYPVADRETISRTIAVASGSQSDLERYSAYKRAEVLDLIARSLIEREAEFVRTIVQESAKPTRYARAELRRAVQTFRLAAGYARDVEGASI